MKWSIGIISAPRPVSTVQRTVDSIRRSWRDQEVFVFSEPGGILDVDGATTIVRPGTMAVNAFFISKDGRFGNFQNWIQAARDLLHHDDSDAILIAEDDASFADSSREIVESRIWPSADCGAVTLYSPNMSHYVHRKWQLGKLKVRTAEPLNSVGNMVGALAIAFPRESLIDLVQSRFTDDWKGSHAQAKDPSTLPWQRKAVDTWIGRRLSKLGYSVWNFFPSMVTHISIDGVNNSSLGHSANTGCRQAAMFSRAGMQINDQTYSKASTKYECVSPR